MWIYDFIRLFKYARLKRDIEKHMSDTIKKQVKSDRILIVAVLIFGIVYITFICVILGGLI